MSYNRVFKNDECGLRKALDGYTIYAGQIIGNQDDSDKFIRFLGKYDHHEEFYTVVNLKTRQITWSQGIQKWTGYPDKEAKSEISSDYFTNHVHPFVREWYKAFNDAATVILTQMGATFLRTRFVIRIPLRIADDRYMLVKQMSMPFELDEQNKIISCINSFSVFGDYKGEALKPEIYNADGEIEENRDQQLRELIVPCMFLKDRRKLTSRHLEIIDIIRELKKKKAPYRAKNIASMMAGNEILKETVDKYLVTTKKRLKWLLKYDELEKLRVEGKDNHYTEGLPKDEDLIAFADQSGIIDLLRAYSRKEPPGLIVSPHS